MIHKRLELLRKKRKISKSELARQLNIPQTTYSGYSLGTREPDLETIIKMANYFKVSVNYLVTGSEEEEALKSVDEVVEMFFNLKESDKKTIEELIRRMAEK